MGQLGSFTETALSFPTVLFTFPLIVVVGYWLLALLGGAVLDDAAGDGVAGDDAIGDAELSGAAGFLAGLGLGGVPVSVTVSLLVAIAWFASLAGSALITGTAALAAVPVAAIGCAWLGTRLLTLPLRRVARKERAPSRADFVGRTCVIRTGRVGGDFGQAEVTAPDGSSALVQVRQTGDDVFLAGSTALIFAYDSGGEFFWVMPYDAELDPHRPI
ncbi:hypothetical protein [Planobispora longispora]|uniref:DUF1449 family protein n=1 Tax=Planobispora longispora TaxID=28887 RepID=A0A8J3RH45_9ACTN|nr:hypothetical protein [Planobispora longispora]BFE87020.1 hypothetical protein GCM10020093_096210 [Planobispora longispora]GIH74685.1 hypothetical protein Plo01_11140 [Planobispora longispora]